MVGLDWCTLKTDIPLVSIANIASKTDYIPPKILRFMLQSAARELLPDERVAECLRTIVPTAQRVEIHKDKQGKGAHYRNLLVCARIWHCPVCASKISEKRRKELSRATLSWGGGLALVTYTASHHSGISLAKILQSVLDAHRDFKSGRFFEEFSGYFGWTGSVKSLEITHGKNGWHPHVHELVFLTNKPSEELTEMFEAQTASRWRHCLKKLGGFASTERGVTVKNSNADVSDYVSKFGDTKVKTDWTFAHELTKQTVKRGKIDGKTPTQLLYDYMLGDVGAGKLWQEYAYTVKGKHQLVWSRGMRDLLKLSEEQTDAEIADEVPQDTEILASLTRGQWYDVLSHDAVGAILQAAETKEKTEFVAWLATTLLFWGSS